MSLYLEATLPIVRALFLNTVHTGTDCYAVKKNDKYDTLRECIGR